MLLFALCSMQPDPSAQPNVNPVQSGPPVLVKTAKNGKLYKVGNGEDEIALLHVWGEHMKERMVGGRERVRS